MLTIMIFLVLGLGFGITATLLILKRSKLLTLKIASCTLALSFFCLCAFYTVGTIKSTQSNSRNLALTLSGIENSNIEKAQIYLQAIKSPNNNHKFIATCCEALVQYINNNSTLANIKLSTIKESALNDDQKLIFTYLQNYTGEQETDEFGNPFSSFSKQCRSLLKLNDETNKKYEELYTLQNYSGGEINLDDTQLNEKFSKAELLMMKLDSSLVTQNFYTALELGTNMLTESPSAKNRMIVAEIIAQMTYSNNEIQDNYFFKNEDATYDTNLPKEQAELKSILKAIEKLDKQVAQLQVKIDLLQHDDEALKPLLQEKDKLTDEITEHQLKYDNIYVYRAINSINDINTIESKILQSRLYFSIRENEKAQTSLKKAADSFDAVMSNDPALVSSLNLVKNIYNNKADASMAGTPELMMALSKINSSVIPELTSIGISSLSNEIAQQISSDLKYKTNDIFINAVDDSQFPKITATLSAGEAVLNDIKNKNNITINDTGAKVEYTVLSDEIKQSMQSVCAVIDVSGSMSGDSILNAKDAVSMFTNSVSTEMEMALGKFSNSGEIITALTSDMSQIKLGLQNLIEGGGTNINDGISVGIDALAQAKGTKTIILLTDGQSFVDNAIIERAITEKVKIIAIGFGAIDEYVLTHVAERTGGMFVRASISEELTSAFANIGAQLGNVVNVEYTVTENLDAQERYLFAKSEDYSCNAKSTYRFSAKEKEVARLVPQIYDVTPGFIDSKLLENYINGDRKISASIYGVNLNLIENISFLGETLPVTISSDGNSCDFEISPNLAENVYDLVMNLTDGTTATVKNFITAYQSDNIMNYSTFKIGSLYCLANRAIKIDDTHVVMFDTVFQVRTNNRPSLYPVSGNVSTPILFTVESIASVEDAEYNYSLGAGGAFEYTGIYNLDNDGYIMNMWGGNIVVDYGQVKGIVNDSSTTITVEDIKNEAT